MSAQIATLQKNAINAPMPWKLWLILGLIFIGNLVLLWPGQMTSDSYNQYEAALTGVYGDHHPPIMSIIWGMLDHLLKGPGLVLGMHLMMLYAAAAIFIFIFRSSRLKWLYLALPLWPHIALYSSMIWKDVGCAFSYLLASALLSLYMMKAQRPPLFVLALIGVLVFYGAAVKFQGMYLLPPMLFGLSFCITHCTVTKKTFFLTGCLLIAFLWGLSGLMSHFVPENRLAHSWQYVKLYDLAAISLALDRPLFPLFLREAPEFSMEKLREKFNYERVDDIAFLPGSPLRKGETAEERSALFACWKTAVIQHPFLYLKHRLTNWWYIITGIPFQKLATLDFSRYKGLNWFNELKNNSSLGSGITKLMEYGRYLFSFFLIFLLAILYFIISCVSLKKERAAQPLLLMQSASIILLITLIFFSMASNMRYVYLVACMVHASHGFAYLCYQRLRKQSSK